MTRGFTTLCITHKSFDSYSICAHKTFFLKFFHLILYLIERKQGAGKLAMCDKCPAQDSNLRQLQEVL